VARFDATSARLRDLPLRSSRVQATLQALEAGFVTLMSPVREVRLGA
jgi:hypothetical protein